MPNALDPKQEEFHVTLMTIYSVENAGIRYVSAALQREGFDTSIIFLRDWVHNSLTMPKKQKHLQPLPPQTQPPHSHSHHLHSPLPNPIS